MLHFVYCAILMQNQHDKLLYAPFSERNLFVGAVNSFVVSLPLVLTVRSHRCSLSLRTFYRTASSLFSCGLCHLSLRILLLLPFARSCTCRKHGPGTSVACPRRVTLVCAASRSLVATST